MAVSPKDYRTRQNPRGHAKCAYEEMQMYSGYLDGIEALDRTRHEAHPHMLAVDLHYAHLTDEAEITNQAGSENENLRHNR